MKKLIIFILALIALAPLGLYFINFRFRLSHESSDWAAFGSYLGGVYGAMAFLAIAYSIYVTGRQFKKLNEDQVFYKSVEDLINVSDINRESNEYKGRQSGSVISLVVSEIYQELENRSSHLARNVLCRKPTIISITNLGKIINCLPRNSLGRDVDINKDEFLRVISECKDFNECWELLKGFFGGVDAEDKNTKRALQDAGSVCFYKVSFEERVYYYQMAWATVEKRYGEMINRYTRNIDFILSHAHEALRSELYRKYLMSRLTKYDIVFLFYFASVNNDRGLIRRLFEFGILGEIKSSECRALMLDYPSRQEAINEIQFIEKRVNELLKTDVATSAV